MKKLFETKEKILITMEEEGKENKNEISKKD